MNEQGRGTGQCFAKLIHNNNNNNILTYTRLLRQESIAKCYILLKTFVFVWLDHINFSLSIMILYVSLAFMERYVCLQYCILRCCEASFLIFLYIFVY